MYPYKSTHSQGDIAQLGALPGCLKSYLRIIYCSAVVQTETNVPLSKSTHSQRDIAQLGALPGCLKSYLVT